MRSLFLSLALFCSLSPRAQYYYNDIVGTLETNRLMKTFLANKVIMVTATGYDRNGVKATDFAEVQEIKENGKALKHSSRTNTDYNSHYYKFDEASRLLSIDDSSLATQSQTNYRYDAAGRVIWVQNNIRDAANDFNQVEVHQWIYNAAGQPEKMWRIINNTDSLEIRFSIDEEGNTGTEKTYKKGVETGTVYYYYDDKKRLSDIVRYNTKYKKLLPDLMFEYDDNDRVIQKITTTSSLHMGYLIWRYIYNDKGLKTKEALFNDEKELTGKIEYNYNFGQ